MEDSDALNFHPTPIPIGDLLDEQDYTPIGELLKDSGDEEEVKPRLVADELSGPQEVVDLVEAEASEVTNRPPKRKRNLSRKKVKINQPKKDRWSVRKMTLQKKGEPSKKRKDSGEEEENESWGEKGGNEEKDEEHGKSEQFEMVTGRNVQMWKPCQVNLGNVSSLKRMEPVKKKKKNSSNQKDEGKGDNLCCEGLEEEGEKMEVSEEEEERTRVTREPPHLKRLLNDVLAVYNKDLQKEKASLVEAMETQAEDYRVAKELHERILEGEKNTLVAEKEELASALEKMRKEASQLQKGEMAAKEKVEKAEREKKKVEREKEKLKADLKEKVKEMTKERELLAKEQEEEMMKVRTELTAEINSYKEQLDQSNSENREVHTKFKTMEKKFNSFKEFFQRVIQFSKQILTHNFNLRTKFLYSGGGWRRQLFSEKLGLESFLFFVKI